MEDYRTQLRMMKVNGKYYKTIAEESGISYGVLRNVVSGYSDTMNAANTEKLKKYLKSKNLGQSK